MDNETEVDKMVWRWREMESNLGKINSRSLYSIPPADILELGRQYNESLSDLGTVQKLENPVSLPAYLNRLLGKVYLTIYRRPQVQLMEFVWFFLKDFPALVWRRIHFIAVAALVFGFSTMIGYLCISNDSKLVGLIVPKQMQESIKDDISRGRIGRSGSDNLKFVISSQIMFNNIKVSFVAFATGIVFGLGTLYVMIMNGMLLGGLASLYHAGGFSREFWALILPHGGIELGCCFIASGAGLVIGYSIFSQTPYRRRSWMAREAIDAVKLLSGTIPWFVLAALIESYVTPSGIPIGLKYFLSGFFSLGFVAYFSVSLSFFAEKTKPSVASSALSPRLAGRSWKAVS